MTWIVDGSGRRWVPHVPRKKRKPARALRFAAIKEGNILLCTRYANALTARGDDVPLDKWTRYLVTDLWFDPVAGERDQTAGFMVALRPMRDGVPIGHKYAHTRRGLAMQGFHYADKIVAARAELSASVSAQLDSIRLGTDATEARSP